MDQLGRFFELSLDLLCIAGTDGYFKAINPAFSDLLGYTRDDLLGAPFLDFVHPDDRARTLAELDHLARGETTIAFENRYRTASNQWRWLSWKAVPEGDLIYAIARDVTDRKQVERLKDEFIASVSHELRTPLTSIRGALGLMAGGAAGALSPQVEQLVRVALRNSERLTLLVNDILDIEKLQQGRLRLVIQPVPLIPLLTQAVESLREYAAQFVVTIELEAFAELTAFADADRLMQVIVNLLSNAVKFSPKGGTVSIRARPEGTQVMIEVEDRGPGIPPEFQAHVFERFRQARQEGHTTGSGLGLHIAKGFVDAMHGSIEFKSVVGSGTTFAVRLPAWRAPVPKTRRYHGDQPRVLVIEDDNDIAVMLEIILEREGYVVDVAGSSTAARQRLTTTRFAAVTLDLMLPDGDGLELIAELQREGLLVDTPVIVISVRAASDSELDAKAVAVVDWIEKPVNDRRLVAALAKAIDARADKRPTILHVEDDPDHRALVVALVGGMAEVRSAATLAEARAELQRATPSLVLLDLRLPDGSGLLLLSELAASDPPVPVVIFAADPPDRAACQQVAAVLLKSQTSNEAFAATLHQLLARTADGRPRA